MDPNDKASKTYYEPKWQGAIAAKSWTERTIQTNKDRERNLPKGWAECSQKMLEGSFLSVAGYTTPYWQISSTAAINPHFLNSSRLIAALRSGLRSAHFRWNQLSVSVWLLNNLQHCSAWNMYFFPYLGDCCLNIPSELKVNFSVSHIIVMWYFPLSLRLWLRQVQ